MRFLIDYGLTKLVKSTILTTNQPIEQQFAEIEQLSTVRQLFKRILAGDAVNGQITYRLKRQHRALCHVAKIAVETAGIVAAADQEGLQRLDIFAGVSPAQVADSGSGLPAENAVNVQPCAVGIV